MVAFDEELRREVALKEIRDQHADNPDSRARFLMEAEVTGGLEHPGVVPVYSLGRGPDGRPFYAMRFIRGESLRKAIERFHSPEDAARDPSERSVEFRDLLRRFIDVCNAIEYAHSRQVIHRDIKPDNIMLGPYGETLVVDWGLAKALDQADLPSRTEELPLKPRLGRRLDADARRLGDRHPGLHGPRAGRGGRRPDGPVQRHLQPRRHPLQPPDRPAAVHRSQPLPDAHQGPRRRVPAAPAGQARGPRGPGGDLPEGDGAGPPRTATRPAGPSPTTSSTGWPTSRSPSTASPSTVRLGRWARRHRTLVTGVVVLLVTAVVGLSIGSYLIDQQRRLKERARQEAVAAREKEAEARNDAVAQRNIAVQEKERADEQRDEAERQRTIADEQRDEAERQRTIADEQAAIARRNFASADRAPSTPCSARSARSTSPTSRRWRRPAATC